LQVREGEGDFGGSAEVEAFGQAVIGLELFVRGWEGGGLIVQIRAGAPSLGMPEVGGGLAQG
jgi:hypothetical protein